MIVSHHAGGLIGHVTAGPRLSYKWRDMPLRPLVQVMSVQARTVDLDRQLPCKHCVHPWKPITGTHHCSSNVELSGCDRCAGLSHSVQKTFVEQSINDTPT
jgi:hypothetical protein